MVLNVFTRLDQWLSDTVSLAPEGSFLHAPGNLNGLLALILVSLSCGTVGSLVVGGRMAFFSDALAHCAFAGVSIGFVLFTTVVVHFYPRADFWDWVTPIMLVFGLIVGYGIVYFRQRTGLASDTVIGVVFAFAIGLAATISRIKKSRELFQLESFLFGNPLVAQVEDLFYLFILACVTGIVLCLTYNHLLLAGFNTSLALSRKVPIQFVSYLFIMLLALIVNLCVRTVGVLLINALLVVPAATAANLGQNLRQVFWWTLLLCLTASVGGSLLAWEVEIRGGPELGIPGTVILLSVAMFIVSAVIGPYLRERRTAF